MVHKNEMVLPPHISQFVQNAASQRSGGEQGQGMAGNFNYAVTVNAIDRNGMEDALREHGDLMFSQWQEQVRQRNMS